MKAGSALILILLLSACASQPELAHEADWEQVVAQRSGDEPLSGQQHGSLYSDRYMFTLYEDKRAYRVGDILTVELNERTQSSKSADASIDKNTGINVGVPLAGNLNTAELAMELNSRSRFDGESAASQQNFLRGSITVRVTDVLANGALAIRGEKWIKLNQGDEYIRLQGLVRPEDIDVTNRISSQRIADARISYSGKGDLASATQAGWFTRLFNRFLNPF
ncbi:flagellar basal body L-ring protein FlgH [Rheinheimera hassiensis]|uniref:flagellar basal body L-ring protein FlgH n=1 Tax=Rheinheimera hassiensis TaxID=1193627 RepID=UPI001F06F8B7|nr:flagellar basal body L-ring protein FlgH [Rheinheimera hassiensis]